MLQKKLIFRFIKKVGLNLEIPGGTRIIDATGKLVIPGKTFIFMAGGRNVDDQNVDRPKISECRNGLFS